MVSAVLIGSLVGLSLVFALYRRSSAWLFSQFKEELAQSWRQQAEEKVAAQKELGRKKLDDVARQNQIRLQSQKRELEEAEKELGLRQDWIAQKEASLKKRDGEPERQNQEVLELRALCEAKAEALAQKEQSLRTALEQKSGEKHGAVAERFVHELLAHENIKVQKKNRHEEEVEKERAPLKARRIMGQISERYDGVGHLERVQNSFNFAHERVKNAFTDADDPAGQIFAREIACILQPDKSGQGLLIRGEDPLARELGRRVLRRFCAAQGVAAQELQAFVNQTKNEMQREVQAAARAALREFNMRLHPEIMDLVGRLIYRLSYSQNQWKHALEVAYIAGMLARELGLDVAKARRGGLLHDIGKALTHDHEGSHAVLGAEVARRCGEEELVANCIGSHHNDEAPQSALAYVVTAADAISGGRPGARREAVTQYMDRISAIQEIASRFRNLERVDIMQAGREVRLFLVGENLSPALPGGGQGKAPTSDQDIHPLAQQVAQTIEDEVVFAGQIRVTVIRETRAMAVAK